MQNPLTPGSPPELITLEGRYCRLEPLSEAHADDFYAAIAPEVEQRFRYLASPAPVTPEEGRSWVAGAANHPEWMYSAVINKQTGKCGGTHALMRIRPEERSVEIGSVIWGEGVSRTRIATEALFLTAVYVFETLQYRRFEWKCNNANEASRRAAIRFGFIFEGVFRQDQIVKGENRDTAWFSILDSEWPALKAKFETWLDPSNFDADGQEKSPLQTPRLS